MTNPPSTPIETAAIEVRGLHVVRGRRVVIDDLDFTVPAGQITGLLGPSGCGKSTLMRALVGVQIVAGGTVELLGVPAGSATLRHRVGYVTQAPSVYGDLTVVENLRYFAAILGVGPAEVDRTIERVDLTAVVDHQVGNLSGGQHSRVSLATALLGSPRVLVLDEPTVGLDPILREQLWSLFHSLADAGVTLLVSSHVMDEADRCHRLLLMREGALIAQGSPAELLTATGAKTVEQAFITLTRPAGDGS